MKTQSPSTELLFQTLFSESLQQLRDINVKIAAYYAASRRLQEVNPIEYAAFDEALNRAAGSIAEFARTEFLGNTFYL